MEQLKHVSSLFTSKLQFSSRVLTTSLVIRQIKPTVILVPSRVDLSGVMDHSQSLAQETGNSHVDVDIDAELS